MFENNERYDCKTVRWIQKIMQCMWILNINDAWKNRLVKYLKIEKFSISVGRASTEYQSSQGEARLEKSRNFWLIDNHTQSIKILEKWIFWKIVKDYAEITQTKEFHEWNTWEWV